MNITGLILVSATASFPAAQLAGLSDEGNATALFSLYLGMAALIAMAWVLGPKSSTASDKVDVQRSSNAAAAEIISQSQKPHNYTAV